MRFHLILVALQIQLFVLNTASNEDVANFFRSVLLCIESLQSEDATSFSQERLYRQLEDHTRSLSSFIAAMSRYDPNNRDIINTLQLLFTCFQNLLSEYATRLHSSNSTNSFVPPTTSTGHRGRPRYNIVARQISHCVSIGMTWQRISSCFGISRRTLYRHRQSLGIDSPEYAFLSNQELDRIITNILQTTPNAGETYVLGSLRSRGIRVQRW